MASNSDSDSDFHDSYDYPNCEEDDCYCKRNWPDRSGGKEHKVVDNYIGEYITLCDVALKHRQHTVCDYCKKFCVESGLTIDGEFNLCVMCCKDDETSLRALVALIYARARPSLLDIFSAEMVDDELVEAEEWNELYKTFHEQTDYDMLFCVDGQEFELRRVGTRQSIIIDGSQRCLIYLSGIISENPKKYETLKDFLMVDFIEFKKEHDNEKRLQAQATKEEARNKAKRAVREYFPEESDEVIDKIVGSKKQKVLKEIPETKNVLAFVEWLKK